MEVSQLGIPYFVCQNETFYFCDYPIFSSQYYTDNGMDIFSDTYYVEGKGLKIFHLELKLAELYKSIVNIKERRFWVIKVRHWRVSSGLNLYSLSTINLPTPRDKLKP